MLFHLKTFVGVSTRRGLFSICLKHLVIQELVLATSSENLGGVGGGMWDCSHIDQPAKRVFLGKRKMQLILNFLVQKKVHLTRGLIIWH